MLLRIATALLAAVVLFAGPTAGAHADTYSVSLGDAVILMDPPDGWKIKEIKRGLQMASPDQEVYIWAEAFGADQIDAIFDEHKEYYEKQKVELGEPQSKEGVINGIKGTFFDFPAKYKGKKTIVQYIILHPAVKSGAQLMLSSWSSVEGDKKYDAVTNAMVGSLKLKK